MRSSCLRHFLWGQKLSVFLPRNQTGQCLIGGELRCGSGPSMSIESPSDAQVVAEVRCASPSDVKDSIDSAKLAFLTHSLPIEGRVVLCRAIASELRKRSDELVTCESLCMGMPLQDARVSVESSAACFDTAAQMIQEGALTPQPVAAFEMITQGRAEARTYQSTVQPEPVGVCAFITPFNYPIEMFAWKVAPCLAAGNSIVWKPPEMAPLSSLVLCEIFRELTKTGILPRGWLNIVQGGAGVGGQLASSHDVNLIGFTGSTKVGAEVQIAAARSNLKRVQLELGGSAALVAGVDANPQRIADLAMQCFNNSGQSCTAIRRVFVPEDRVREVLLQLTVRIKKRRIGHALDPSTEMGPLVSAAALERVLSDVQRATTSQKNVKLVMGGFRATLPAGYYCTPTVLVAQDPNATVLKEELFGPVVTIVPYPIIRSSSASKWESFEAAVRMANHTKYGLSAVVLSDDANEVSYAVRRLECGTVWVDTVDAMNGWTPFGGVKQSGYGKDLGIASVVGYSTMKTVTAPKGG